MSNDSVLDKSDPSVRETLTYDLAIVGAGPSGLACAVRLKQLDPGLSVCVLEKGASVGAHILSGAVIETQPLDELFPSWRNAPPPSCIEANAEQFWWLTRTGALRLPIPPQMRNKGNRIVSLGSLCAWMAQQAEQLEVEIFPGFAAAEVLIEREEVNGVRVGSFGVDRSGRAKPSHSLGVDIRARFTVLAEGCRGHLSKRLIHRYGLDGVGDPQGYGLGFKELWQVPDGRLRPGLVQHSIGWPLDNSTYGGGFLYHCDAQRVAVGLVIGLDYSRGEFSPFDVFRQFKHHPMVRALLEGGNILSGGARALSEGGYQSLPVCEMPGALLIGDAAGMLNVPKIKGVHNALRAGMLAAEHIVGTGDVAGFDARLRGCAVGHELKKVRNIRPGFRYGLWWGLSNALWETASGGRSPWTLRNRADHAVSARAAPPAGSIPDERRDLPPHDRAALAYFAAVAHEEDQPIHLRIRNPEMCTGECREKHDNPCTRFCPTQVFEMVDEAEGTGLRINASNCIHCKACDIKDPYQIVDWVPPEGGSGPNYRNL